MKNLLLYLALFIVAMAGCKDDDANPTDCPFLFTSSSNALSNTIGNPESPKHPCDYLMTNKNGEQWTVHATSSFSSEGDTLYIHGHGHEESLGFKFFFTGTGTYELEPKGNDSYFRDNAYYYTTVGGDVIMSYYGLAEKGTFKIVEYIESEKVIKGNFELSLKKYSAHSGPDTLKFYHGTFSVHLPD